LKLQSKIDIQAKVIENQTQEITELKMFKEKYDEEAT